MIFLDSDIFLRFLTAPTDDASALLKERARDLFHGILSGSIEATTSEVVLHEVSYVLTSRRQYGIPASEVIRMLRPLIVLRSLKLGAGEKSVVLRALDLWDRHPTLEFSDSVIAARCEANNWELATFDEQLGSLPEITRWQAAPL